MESEKAKIGCPQTSGEQKKRPDLCQFIDKDPIEIKKRLLEVPLTKCLRFMAECKRFGTCLSRLPRGRSQSSWDPTGREKAACSAPSPVSSSSGKEKFSSATGR